MTIEIKKPETEALIEQHLNSGRFHDVDELLSTALRTLPASLGSNAAGDKDLVELFEPVRGLFADGELDFSRTRSVSRPLDLS